METTSCAVHTAFRTALLLAGATKTAELAVLDGIDACENISHRRLLIETVRSTIRRRTESPDVPDGINLLPPELRRLFWPAANVPGLLCSPNSGPTLSRSVCRTSRNFRH